MVSNLCLIPEGQLDALTDAPAIDLMAYLMNTPLTQAIKVE